jgi:dTDP-4-dehydrorhamnose 3,5-epimerase
MDFTVTELAVSGVLLITPRRIDDPRGYFMETYRSETFERLGMPAMFMQDNQALSREPGTIRGLHYQAPPHAQAKLVRVLRGAIFDVAVDLRRGAATFGRWVGTTLTAETGSQLFVPRGFAHGYCTLSPDTEVAYKCDNYYAADAEGGVLYSDPDIGIDWPVNPAKAAVSERDRRLPRLSDVDSPFLMELQ